MRQAVISVLVTAMLCLTAVGQNHPANNSLQIAAGSVIPVQLSRAIDAKKAKTGDQVVATVTQDMKTEGGELLVPKSAKVIGHVTEAQAHSKEQKESRLGMVFDQVVLKNGPVQLPTSIQAVIWMQSGGGSGSSVAMPVTGMASAGGGGLDSAPGNSGGPNTSQMAPITGQTQGVIGIPFVKLGPGSNGQGSVLTCEKGNVKLEEGTMLMLKVN